MNISATPVVVIHNAASTSIGFAYSKELTYKKKVAGILNFLVFNTVTCSGLGPHFQTLITLRVETGVALSIEFPAISLQLGARGRSPPARLVSAAQAIRR